MENLVGVVKGTEKFASFQELLALTRFDEVLLSARAASRKSQRDFKIVIKPNMMVFIKQQGHLATVTDKELVEFLIDHILELGFANISICEAQHDVGRILNNYNVQFIANQIGYEPRSRYKIVDLSLESISYPYEYCDDQGRLKTWKDWVGKTWKEADFRITFAKCKTHEHDWMTLGVKNIYGCFPCTDKITRYHIRNEVPEITARSLRNFPLHFSFIDGWLASDGFQGYKIPHPVELNMLFGGKDAIAVDMEVFKRAGIYPQKSKFLGRCVRQLSDSVYPQYTVVGDQSTLFSQVAAWNNIEDVVVEGIDVLEEVYVSWGFINIRPAMEVDYDLFPPKSWLIRLFVSLLKKLNSIFKLARFSKKISMRITAQFARGGGK